MSTENSAEARLRVAEKCSCGTEWIITGLMGDKEQIAGLVAAGRESHLERCKNGTLTHEESVVFTNVDIFKAIKGNAKN